MGKGTVYIPTVNIGAQEVVLYPRTVLGTVSEAYLVNSPDNLVEEGVAATVSLQTTASLVKDKINAAELSALTQEGQCQVGIVLQQCSGIYYEGDLGCTNMISHDKPVTR